MIAVEESRSKSLICSPRYFRSRSEPEHCPRTRFIPLIEGSTTDSSFKKRLCHSLGVVLIRIFP
jgi:hypothetical protein